MGKEALMVALKDLAGQLGINLTKRKALEYCTDCGGGE
jgi:hypothetical protein